MNITPRLRKFVLLTHITFSVGWFGAVVPYLALTIAGLTSHDVQVVRAAYFSMELIGWFVIVPFSIAALLTGRGSHYRSGPVVCCHPAHFWRWDASSLSIA